MSEFSNKHMWRVTLVVCSAAPGICTWDSVRAQEEVRVVRVTASNAEDAERAAKRYVLSGSLEGPMVLCVHTVSVHRISYLGASLLSEFLLNSSIPGYEYVHDWDWL